MGRAAVVGVDPHHRGPDAHPAWLAETHGGDRYPVAANALAKRGIQPAEPLAVILIAIETIGGLCIALGLFTRFWAAAAAIEMTVIVYHHLPKFGWTDRGYEYPLFWGLVMLAIALRGGGPYSSIRIGREL
jgi:putative oxidoreductase